MTSTRIKALRSERDLSRAELARLSGVGVRTLYGIEHGHHAANMNTLARVAAALDVPVHTLVDDHPDAAPPTPAPAPGTRRRWWRDGIRTRGEA